MVNEVVRRPCGKDCPFGRTILGGDLLDGLRESAFVSHLDVTSFFVVGANSRMWFFTLQISRNIITGTFRS